VVHNYLMTRHDPMVRDWLRDMLRSGCSDVVDNYLMTRHDLMTRDWLRDKLRLEGLDYLRRPDDSLWNGHKRHLRDQRSAWLDNESPVRLLRDRRLGVRNLNAGHQRNG
jgi:hypothetical protein